MKTRSRSEPILRTEQQLVSAALALDAASISGISPQERALIRQVNRPLDLETANWLGNQIRLGQDPLGDAFCGIRTAGTRREKGATYTPKTIVQAMVVWALRRPNPPIRIVDPGTGSARFLLAAAREFPRAELVGIEIDPLAALIARANLAAVGARDRAAIHLADFRSFPLPVVDGETLFIGNPPYVRHHLLGAAWKTWLTEQAKKLGYSASQLAGLHVHFFLATVLQAREGDYGAFVTSAEWLDVNYGKLVRELFLGGLGGQGLTIVDPKAKPFADAATTAVISTFEIGSTPSCIRVRRASNTAAISPLEGGVAVKREDLQSRSRWSRLTQRSKPVMPGFIELGEICRVHRGQVTGSNRIWIAGAHSCGLPSAVLFRCVTKAKELFAAGSALADASSLRDVIDIPADLSVFDSSARSKIEKFLRFARDHGAADGYVAGNRRAWWSVGLREPAPILATYMARRPPAFVRNLVSARHINIAHGLYPRERFPDTVLDRLAGFLNRQASLSQGRIYAGGLTKFEPREMERLLVPSIEVLRQP